MKRRKKDTLTDLEFDVCAFLMEHKGRENAVSRQELCDHFADVGERKLRKTMEHLILRHKAAIGSCLQGYYWAKTPEDIEKACEFLYGYGVSAFRRISSLRGAPLRKIVGQLFFDAMRGKLEEQPR